MNIPNRLETIEELKGKFDLLDPEQVRPLFEGLVAFLREEPEPNIREIIETLSESEIRVLSCKSGIAPEWLVAVIWPYNRTGVRLKFSDFVENYDDFWYPSSDDVFVFEEQTRSLLVFDHEQILTIYHNVP